MKMIPPPPDPVTLTRTDPLLGMLLSILNDAISARVTYEVRRHLPEHQHPDETDTLTVQEVCGLLRVTDRTLLKWRQGIGKGTHDFPQPTKVGLRLLWRKGDVLAWMRTKHRHVIPTTSSPTPTPTPTPTSTHE